MYIGSAQVVNYKSYSQTPELSLDPGFNVFIGKNSAGKSALLEALSFRIQNVPHRSLTSQAPRHPKYAAGSQIDVVMVCSGREFQEFIETPELEFYLAAPKLDTFPLVTGFDNFTPAHAKKVLAAICAQDRLEFAGRFEAGPLWSVPKERGPSLRLYAGECQWDVAYYIRTQGPGQFQQIVRHNQVLGGHTATEEVGSKMLAHLAKRVYGFSAKRVNSGICQVGVSTALEPDAANLAEVLSNLQSANPGLYRDFNYLVSAVIPQIKWVAVENAEENNVRIKIWQNELSTRRGDLSIPLADSGSGVGQVLAMLYVAVTEDEPRTILIDEPQTFLHPGALRKLLEILSSFAKHQFVIATHSPSVLSSVAASRIYLLEHDGQETKIRQLDVNYVEHARLVLAEVGANWSDVFGADAILWVEGPTEEQCFPLIVHTLLKKPLRGLMIKSLINTGDLNAQHAKLVMEIYQRMSHSTSVLPPTVGFLLDDECRKTAERDNLRARSGNRLYFIQRTMYENYLLEPSAIASLLNEYDTDRSTPILLQDVATLLSELISQPEFYPQRVVPEGTEDKAKLVHGGRVLERLFATLTECRVSYAKTVHGVMLTKFLLQHDSAELQEIAELLDGLLFPQKELQESHSL